MNRRSILQGLLALPVLVGLILVGERSGAAVGGEQRPERQHQLAVLIAASPVGEPAMANDQAAIEKALLQRGVQSEEILKLGGALNRTQLLTFLREVAQRAAQWQDGSVFLAYSGHGDIQGTTVKKPGVKLPSGETVLWEEIFEALRLPQDVHLILLPDC